MTAVSGASCPRQHVATPAVQPVFAGPPQIDEVIRVVNANSAPIQQLQGRGAELTIPNVRSLRTQLVLERPRRFRLRADTPLMGAELDLGSNDEIFWMWVKRADPPAVYFCRHEQYYSSAARQLLPVQPDWLISALGIVKLDPMGRHSGPQSAGPGRLRIISQIASPEGPITRVLVVDDTQGTVLEQHLYNQQQQLLASSLASQHRREPVSSVVLPHHVEIRLPSTGMSFAIDVDHYEVNQLEGGTQYWRMPNPSGYPLADLAAPSLQLPGGVRTPGNVATRPPSRDPYLDRDGTAPAHRKASPRWARRRRPLLQSLFGH